jgi:hypothetical protein
LMFLPAAGVPEASAQMPSHPPGSICKTRTIWCWANPPGKPGGRCGCPTPYGRLTGTLQ